MTKLQSINPFTEELNAEFDLISREELSEKIDTAHKAFLEWKKTPNSRKKELMLKLADTISKNRNKINVNALHFFLCLTDKNCKFD